MFENKYNHSFRLAGYGIIALWLVAAILVLLFETTPLELNEAKPKAVVYLTAVLGLPFVLAFLLNRQFRLSKAKTIIFGSVLFVSILAIGASSLGAWFVFAKLTVWKTTSVFYRHKDNPRVVLGEQMKDVGALGYRRRFVRSVELTSFLSYSVPVDERSATEAGAEWQRLDESRNAFDWKGA